MTFPHRTLTAHTHTLSEQFDSGFFCVMTRSTNTNMDASDHFDALAHTTLAQNVEYRACMSNCVPFSYSLYHLVFALNALSSILSTLYCIRSLFAAREIGEKSGIAWCGWIARAAHFISIHITHVNSLDSSVRDRVFCHIAAHSIRFASSRAHTIFLPRAHAADVFVLPLLSTRIHRFNSKSRRV